MEEDNDPQCQEDKEQDMTEEDNNRWRYFNTTLWTLLERVNWRRCPICGEDRDSKGLMITHLLSHSLIEERAEHATPNRAIYKCEMDECSYLPTRLTSISERLLFINHKYRYHTDQNNMTAKIALYQLLDVKLSSAMEYEEECL
jgi:hypothetical protein